MTLHGALLDLYGVGTLLLGPSGIGKSECALELVSRGHKLVADDVVELCEAGPGRLVGQAPERIRHYMEIRGLGIIFVPDLFGPDSVREEMPIELLCRLEEWREGSEFERVGIDRDSEEVGGVRLPRVVLAARPAGGLATVVEVAARDHRQRAAGVNAARRLDTRLRDEMGRA